MTQQQTTLIETAVNVNELAKQKLTLSEAVQYIREQGYSDEYAYDAIRNGIQCVAQPSLEICWNRWVDFLQDNKGTPLWKRLLNGFAVAFVKALANDGKLNLADLPVLVEEVYKSIKNK